jgi:hypothetical protein
MIEVYHQYNHSVMLTIVIISLDLYWVGQVGLGARLGEACLKKS